MIRMTFNGSENYPQLAIYGHDSDHEGELVCVSIANPANLEIEISNLYSRHEIIFHEFTNLSVKASDQKSN